MLSIAVAVTVLGSALAFPSDCPNVTVIEDVTRGGWYDGCLGLTYQEDSTTAAACEEQCKADMNCSVWQMTKSGGKEKCWSGSVVHGCRSRGSDAALGNFEEDLLAGQRMQHGFIKVVSTDSKIQTIGLRHYPEKTGTQEEQIARCKDNCYTTVTCTVWQYGSDGCWVEHGPDHYKKSTTTNGTWAAGMIAGETIEHTCPPYVAPGMPWGWIIAGIVLGLLALAAIVYLLRPKPKVKKTRAVKIEPKPEPQVVYFIPQPTILIPQQSVVQVPQYQPVTTVQTMAAPTTAVQQPLLTTNTLLR